MKESERDLNFFALLMQMQVIEATVIALIQTHPDPEDLKERMQSNYSLLVSALSTGLIGEGTSSQYLSALRPHMDKFLEFVSDEENESD